jgi:hypothetical protein
MKPLAGLLVLAGITATTVGAYLASHALGLVVLGVWWLVLGIGMAKT